MEKRKGGLRRLAILFALATVGVLAVGAQAASANVIEICKSSANGMSGRTFQYSITGGSSVSVNGGRCSGPITVAGTQVTITEGQSNPATDVASTTVRPSIRKISEDLPNRSVTVTTGASTSSETLVTFVNQPAGGNLGTLKVCKLTQTPAYLGRLFSFSVNGGPLVSTEANDAFDDPANWSCRILGSFQVGSTVTVREQIPAGTEVQFIDSDPATALVDFDTSLGTGIYTIGAGTTVALFDDEPIPPSGTGTLEICKTAAELAPGVADPDVHGPFTFTAVDAAGASYGPFTINVPNPNLGQVYCTDGFTVAAGIAEVTEGPSPGFDLVDAFAFPGDRFLTANLINRTVDVEVPTSADPNDETQAIFVNQTQRAQLKLCKALGPGSADLIKQVFYIDWSSDSGTAGTAAITAQATTQCVVVGFLPIGATVTLSEQNPGQFVDSSGPSSITLASGINQATFTNTARGLLEVCKTAGARHHDAADVPVPHRWDRHAQRPCGHVLAAAAGLGREPHRDRARERQLRARSWPAAHRRRRDQRRPGDGRGQSQPEHADSHRQRAVRPGRDRHLLQPHQARPGQGLQGHSVDLAGLAWRQAVRLRPSTVGSGTGGFIGPITLGPIMPGECTSFSPSFPVLYPNGKNRAVGVVERPDSGVVNYTVTSIALTSGTRGLCTPGDPNSDPVICNQNPNPNLAMGIVDFYLGPGNNIITYNNKANDP